MRSSHTDSIEHISPNSEVRALAFVAVGLLAAAAAVVSTASAQTPTAIGRSTRLEESLKPGDSREYGLRLKRGESAEVIVRQEGVDVVVDLVSPAGKLLDSVDGPTGRNGDEVVEIIARDSGVYLLKVSPLDKSEPPGDFRLEVRALRGTRETEDLLRKVLGPRRLNGCALAARGVAVPVLSRPTSTSLSWTISRGARGSWDSEKRRMAAASLATCAFR